mgnify:FL=1
MTFKIYFPTNLGLDYFTLVGKNIDDIRDSAKRELEKRGIDESTAWTYAHQFEEIKEKIA